MKRFLRPKQFLPTDFFFKKICGAVPYGTVGTGTKVGWKSTRQGGPQDAYPRAPMRAGAAWPCPRLHPTPRVSSSPLCAAPDASHTLFATHGRTLRADVFTAWSCCLAPEARCCAARVHVFR